LRRLAFIRVSQRVGIPLARIRTALESLPDERTPTAQDWARLSSTWRTELNARIEQLQRLRDDLTDCIGCGCLSLERCVLSNPHDELAAQGPGPRRLLTPGLDDPAPETTDQRPTGCCARQDPAPHTTPDPPTTPAPRGWPGRSERPPRPGTTNPNTTPHPPPAPPRPPHTP